MRSLCLASALVLASSPVALAAGADALSDAFSKFPQVIVTNPEPVQAYFVNMEALQAIGQHIGSEHGFAHQRMAFGAIGAVKPLTMASVETWEGNSGIELAKVRYFAGMGVPPQMISVWGLNDEATVTGLLEALSDADFEPVGSAGVIGNGEPMAANLRARQIGNPWRDELGRATFVGQTGNGLVQSGIPQAVEFFLKDGENASDHPVVATALGSLDAITNAGLVVQAMLISPTFGLQGGDFGSIALSGSTDMSELRSQLEASLKEAGQGIPPYFGGIIADVQNERPELVMTLIYSDCETAETATHLIEARWQGTMADSGAAAIRTGTREGVDGLCAAAVSVEAQNAEPDSNPHAKAMFNAFMKRQFNVLQIGESAQ
ncbi:hypothetical protein FPY71_02240 [Aureimonas fodinaquatilis]|uniref:Uncharacterized protein n=1 Tax=Aureimonas fodinaquatilis TaxID=2565783 RepID=A0A5B0DZU5_9HYPH|nr:hypothetical protein [Aureimonas fodinaquatilis]KAA0971966.1 hypothetical protein FPY71_02240 [Aureimonas fodinaquatilis]